MKALALTVFCLLLFACRDVVVPPIAPPPIEPDEMIQTPVLADSFEGNSCLYEFDSSLASIYGVWEPKLIIDLAIGDSTYFATGKGHTGFILGDHYADAFELRPDSSLSLYYVEYGRHCADRKDGIWLIRNDSLIISRNPSDSTKLPIVSLAQDELEVEDTVNFIHSRTIYRKSY